MSPELAEALLGIVVSVVCIIALIALLKAIHDNDDRGGYT